MTSRNFLTAGRCNICERRNMSESYLIQILWFVLKSRPRLDWDQSALRTSQDQDHWKIFLWFWGGDRSLMFFQPSQKHCLAEPALHNVFSCAVMLMNCLWLKLPNLEPKTLKAFSYVCIVYFMKRVQYFLKIYIIHHVSWKSDKSLQFPCIWLENQCWVTHASLCTHALKNI